MQKRHRLLLSIGSAALTAALAVGAFVASTGVANSTTTSSKFTPNQMLPGMPLTAGDLAVSFIVRALEPSNRVDQQGTIYVGSIRGVPGGVDAWRWSPVVDGAPNADGTLPFKYLGQPDGCGLLAGGCAAIGVAEGGGDIDFSPNAPHDTTKTPNVALSSLTLAGVTTTNSTDRGNTWAQPNPIGAEVPGDDRQWLDAYDYKTVYMAFHDVATFNIDVLRSTDGGLTYANGTGEAIDAATYPTAGGVPPTNAANILGNIAIDKTSCGSRGNLYQIFVAPDSATENVQGGALRSVYVGVSKDAKNNLPTYTFTDHKVFTGAAGSSQANVFPAIAVDKFGNVYAAWSDNADIWYSYSTNQGSTWAAARKITGVNAGHANVMPWIAADSNGHAVVTWFGADRAGNSNDTAVMEPCTSGSTTCMENWAKWRVYFAETVNGHASSPSFHYNIASDHVVHYGTISTGGLNGNANRDLGDYFQVSLDPKHRANIAFGDTHAVSPLTDPAHTGQWDPAATRLIRAYFTRERSARTDIVSTGSCAK